MADMYDSPQERDTFIDRWIAELGRVVLSAMDDFLTVAINAVLGPSGPPDPGEWPRRSVWGLIVDEIIMPIIETIIGQSTSQDFDARDAAGDYVVRIRVRLVNVMDQGIDDVRRVMDESRATDATVDMMRTRVASVLGDEAATQQLLNDIEAIDETLAAGGLTAEERADLTAERRILTEQTNVDIDRWQHRAERVAHTETIGAHNYGVETEAATVDPDAWKQWWAMQDNRTRPAHRVAHRQTVPLREMFRVGGVQMAYPGDESAPAHLVINCRCIMRIRSRAEGEQLAADYDANRTNITDSDGVMLDDDGNPA